MPAAHIQESGRPLSKAVREHAETVAGDRSTASGNNSALSQPSPGSKSFDENVGLEGLSMNFLIHVSPQLQCKNFRRSYCISKSGRRTADSETVRPTMRFT